MKKQIFSFLLVLAMLLTWIPLTVSAADYVAKIGDTMYATLDEALAAAQDGDVVEVLKSCSLAGTTISKSITVKAMDGLEEKPQITLASSIVPGKDTALTFEGLKFYSTRNDFSFGAASAGSALTLKNCDVESNGYYCVFIDAHGITLNVEGGEYRSNFSVIHFGSTMPQTNERIIVNVTGATMSETANLESQYAVISNNNGKSNVEIHIDNSTLNALAPQDALSGSCIKIGGFNEANAAANNVLTVKNSTLNSNAQYGIYVERTAKTDITIEGSTLNLNSSMTGGACIKADGVSKTVENLTLTIKGDNARLNSKSQYCVYFNATKNSAILLEGGKLTVEETTLANAWAVSTYNTPADARAKVTVNGAEIDTAKTALSFDANTDFSMTAGKLNEEKSNLSFGGKTQTAQGNPFTEQLYAQLLQGTTAESEETNVRFAIQLPTAGYTSYGYLVSSQNSVLLLALANGGKILTVETQTLYSAILANGEAIGTEKEGYGWLALGIDGIPQSAFDTEFRIRPYAVAADGTVLLGETHTFTVNGLLSMASE
ncbi:MAG TPA: hypothetical protein DDW30_05085 [Clostridiales bacterium]|nr:hypothetical protein [Clostridiales bacterium]